MFAGKSRRLIMKLSKKQDLGLRVAYVTHGIDDRLTKGGNSSLTTHWSCFRKADVPFDCYRTDDLATIYSNLLQYDVIGIDEFQFFSASAVKIVQNLVETACKRVYCVSLDGTFKREKFGYILDLIPIADKSRKIKAKCEWCKRAMIDLVTRNLSPQAALVSAPFTAKIGGHLNLDTEVGAEDMYLPLCRHHYLEYARDRQIQ